MDWRDFDKKVDAVFSIGAIEHFQVRNFTRFFKKIYSILAEKTGRACIHSIFSSIPIEKRSKNKWLQEKIFTGGEIPDLKSFITSIEKASLELINMQIIRGKNGYVPTLQAWISNLRKNKNKIVRKFIIDSSNIGCKKVLIITGKGLRSKVYNNPYLSEKMNVLKNSIPDF